MAVGAPWIFRPIQSYTSQLLCSCDVIFLVLAGFVPKPFFPVILNFSGYTKNYCSEGLRAGNMCSYLIKMMKYAKLMVYDGSLKQCFSYLTEEFSHWL